ncbi:MAG TPA: hypothetical protein VFT75_13225 [Nocardioidaceae bacterium]|nr:hypothetical protein [Nocardioidaceae bacterium]
MRPLPLTAAAVLSAATLAVPVAPALAAGHGHGHVKTHAAHTASHDHLTQQERGASQALANQLRQVTRLADRAAASGRVSDVDRDAVGTALQADADALTALQDQLTTATTHHDLVDAVHQGILVRAVARTQFTVAAQAGHVRQQADALATTSPDLQTQADTAGADADTAIAAVLALTTDSTRAEVNDARDAAEAALADAETALETTVDDSAAAVTS